MFIVNDPIKINKIFEISKEDELVVGGKAIKRF